MKDKLYSESEIMTKLSHTEPLFGGDDTKERYRYMQWLADLNAIKEIKSDNAIIIPDGATNGDVIRAMFSNIKGIEKAFEIEISANKNKVGNVSMEWWNAPYKSEEEL